MTGIWHQGAILSACLAELGYLVVGVCTTDADARRLAAGDAPVPEPLLGETILRNVEAGRLEYTADLRAGLEAADFVFISADTPVRENDTPDTAPVVALAERIRDEAVGPITLCVTAQVPVGVTEGLAAVIGAGPRLRLLGYAYVPEFLQLGTAIESFRRADRVVIGADDSETAERVAGLYRPLGRPLVLTGVRTAELAKHASNVFLATSISLVNEIADVAGAVGADPFVVAEILRLDRRIGPHAYLTPGLGFAGGTLGRELRTLQDLAHRHGLASHIADAALVVNDARRERLLGRLRDGLGGLDGTLVAFHGLTYKPGTPTLRRATSLQLAQALAAEGASVRAFDPLAVPGEASTIDLAGDVYSAAKEADAVAVLIPWSEGLVDLHRLRSAMRGDLLVDAPGTIGRRHAAAAGFRYVALWADGAT